MRRSISSKHGFQVSMLWPSGSPAMMNTASLSCGGTCLRSQPYFRTGRPARRCVKVIAAARQVCSMLACLSTGPVRSESADIRNFAMVLVQQPRLLVLAMRLTQGVPAGTDPRAVQQSWDSPDCSHTVDWLHICRSRCSSFGGESREEHKCISETY